MRRIRAIWYWWLTPTHPDPDEAFRERTLRVTVALMILANGVQISFMLLTPEIRNSRAVALLAYMLFNLSAGIFIQQGRLNIAAALMALVVFVALGISQTRQGYWSGYMVWLLAISVMFGVLVFPRAYAAGFGTLLVVEFTVIAFWQEQVEAPYTGLGLAILKEIVDRHAGRVEVHSTGIPGEGTRFSILLPPVAGPAC